MSIIDITSLSLAEIVGDFGFKSFARSGSAVSFAQGTIGYIAIVYFLIRSLKIGNVLYVNGMWDGISALLESVAAYVILGERLQRPTEYIGLGMIIVGIFFLRTPKGGKIPY
jgi:multidrug transporter EmrE-like cation transporter